MRDLVSAREEDHKKAERKLELLLGRMRRSDGSPPRHGGVLQRLIAQLEEKFAEKEAEVNLLTRKLQELCRKVKWCEEKHPESKP